MSWKTLNESIELVERRFHYFPQVFRWRGRRYDIDEVEREWTPPRPPWRRYYRVHCAAGVVVLYHDLTANTWHLGRARWAAEPSRRARFGLRQIAF